jgi:hypothetical protein
MKKFRALALIVWAIQIYTVAVCQQPDSVLTAEAKLHNTVEHNRKGAQAWRYSWIGGYSAATAAQGIIAASSDDKSLRQDMILGAATTFLGVVGTVLSPLVPDRKYMESQMKMCKDSLSASAYDEVMLKEMAKREKAGRSWKVHAAAGVVDLGSGLITWLGYKRTFRDGLINFALNTVIAEAQIWSQPLRAVRDYKKIYGSVQGIRSSRPGEQGCRLYLGSYPGGVTLRAIF